MRLKEIQINGLSGWEFGLKLTGRDFLAARNMSGKTTLVRGVEFVHTGAITDVKKDDLIGLGMPATDTEPEGFNVWEEWDRGDGTDFRISRRLKVTRTGKVSAKQELEFIPAVPGKIRELEARLVAEFVEAPVVFFDAAKFMAGSDTDRLKSLMDVAGQPEGVDPFQFVRDAEMPEGVDGDAWEKLKADLTNQPRAVLPSAPVEAVLALRDLVAKWGSDARAAKEAALKTIQNLGAISREQAFGHGVNVEAEEARQKELAAEILEYEKETSAAEERERQRKELEGMARAEGAALLQNQEELDAAKVARPGLESEEARLVSSVTDRGAKAETWGSEQAEQVERIQGEATALHEKRVKHAETVSDLLLLRQAATEERTDANLDHRGALMDHEQAKKDLADWTGLHGEKCPTCEQGIQEEAHARLADALALQEDVRAKELEEKAGVLQAKKDTHQKAAEAFDDAAREGAEMEAEALSLETELERARTEKNPHAEGLAKVEAEYAEAQGAVRKNGEAILKLEGLLDRGKARKADLEKRAGDLHQGLPEEDRSGLLEGSKLEKVEVDERLQKARDLERRYADQSAAQRTRRTQEALEGAAKEWVKIMKGAMSTVMALTLGPALAPAEMLVTDALPGYRLELAWEDQRGNPGLRIGLSFFGQTSIPWAGMSGVQRAIVGVGLTLAVASAQGNPPALLLTDGDAFDRYTIGEYLAALDGLAGPVTGLVVTSHHEDAEIPEGWSTPALPAPRTA